MRTFNSTLALGMIICLCLVFPDRSHAQGYDTPLTTQGLNHTTSQSAASRAMGGGSFGVKNDVSLMFSNPASLTSIEGIQVSFGGMQQYLKANQDQRYGALQTYAAFSLLTESMTNQIADPDTTPAPGRTSWRTWTQADSVQRPFDSIGPDWNRAKSKSLPIQAQIAVPVTLAGIKFIVGVGAVEYANLNYSYQNNNVFSPSVLSVLNGTIATGPLNITPYKTQWYQYYQERSGSIYGYGGMLSAAVTEKLSVGVSGMLLKGSTDDLETRVGRGRMVFFSSSLRLDKQGMTSSTKTGTSDYSGTEFTGSATYSSSFIDFGFTVKPPTTITRKFTTAFTQDSVSTVNRYAAKSDSIHVQTSSSVSGEDNIKLPWRGSLGFAIRIRENITVGVDYEIRSFESAKYTAANGIESNPWLSTSVFHIGAEYRVSPWLALRAGQSTYKEVFEPLSNPIRGDAVSYPVYSAGLGFTFANAAVNITYEYSEMKYVDMWSNAASINQQVTNNIMANISYTIPWSQ
jgi:opacity protein-like surface antigen